MQCLFINLEGASARRAALEESFRSYAPAGWELVRIPASGPADVDGAPGSISPAEKACWTSHRKAISASLIDDEDVLILEDDTRFGPRTFEMIGRLRAANLPWDLLFTEVSLRVESMLPYAQRYPQLAASGAVSVNDLNRLGFTAAAGYLVRGASKAKLVALLEGTAMDRPYDFHLQHLTHAGQIRSLFCFPFITQPGAGAEDSQIQPDPFKLRDQAHLAFRRLMFLDRDLDALEPDLARLQALHGERGAAMVGQVFGALASDAMRVSAPGGPKGE